MNRRRKTLAMFATLVHVGRLLASTFVGVSVLFTMRCTALSGTKRETDGGSLTVATDRQEYVAQRTPALVRVRIVATYTNRSTEPRYVATCGDVAPRFVVERADGDHWKVSYQPVCQLVQAPPHRVAPGASRVDTLILAQRVGGVMEAGSLPVDSPGKYRIVYAIFEKYDAPTSLESDVAPLVERISNTFTISP